MRRLGLLLSLSLVVPALRPVEAEPASVPDPSPVIVQPDSLAQPTATVEARMRKLHLVRPDLIAYPLAYDVYC